ncbi:MAG: ABC transporter permease subunit [Planctomycetes bacterium]|nr:ABC transporter permease subunit [Planctomycetota bacterium]
MRQLLAVMKDSLRQAMDRKAFIVLFVLAIFPILFSFSVSFEPLPLAPRIAEVAGNLRHFDYQAGFSRVSTDRGAEISVGEVRTIGDESDLPDSFRGGHVFDLTFSRVEDLDGLVREWARVKERIARKGRGKPEAEEKEQPAEPVAPERRIAFLEERFQSQGFNRVRAVPDPDTPGRFRVALRADRPEEVRGAHALRLVFGQIGVPLKGVSAAEIILQIQLGFAEFLAGFVVMIVALSATSSFVPGMLEKGTLDLALARPIGRARLLLFKYIGGLWFIALFAVFLIGGCWLGFTVRTHLTTPWFLFSAVTLMATFAVLYSVSVLAGVLTRSSGLSALAAIGVWWVSSIIVDLRHQLRMFFTGADPPRALERAFDIAYAILPKTKDLGHLNTFALSRAQLSPDAFARTVGEVLPRIDWVYSLGTTAAFTAAMLALACWRFSRKDY